MLESVTREQTLTQRAEQQLEDLIVSGRLQAGERLPSEADMGKMLGVSRTVVREAVRLLSAKGLVDVRSGSGIYVRALSGELIRDPIELLLRHGAVRIDDIVEARVVMEVHLAGRAAERAEAADIRRMRETIEAVAAPGLTPREYAERDVAFHAALAVAGRNPLFVILSETIHAVMRVEIESEFRNNPRAQDDTVQEHSRILNRVKAGDVEGARRAMSQTLAHAPDHWRAFGHSEVPLVRTIGGKQPRGKPNGATAPGRSMAQMRLRKVES